MSLMRKNKYPLKVEICRGPMVESTHLVDFVILDTHGSLYKAWGDVNHLVYPRSSIKFIQALPYLRSGAYAQDGMNNDYLALACSSHRAEPKQLEILKAWALQLKVSEAQLACGPVNGSRFNHNCSGKHLAAISTCLKMGWSTKDYHSFEHPYQQEVRKQISVLSGQDIDKLPLAVDGCGFPTVAMPLQSLAQCFMPIINNTRKELNQDHVVTLMNAITSKPDLFSGETDLASYVFKKSEGQLIVKSGAEGVFIGIAPKAKLVFAMKCHDGASRGIWIGLLTVFNSLKIISDPQLKELMTHPLLNPVNSRGETVGSYKVQ